MNLVLALTLAFTIGLWSWQSHTEFVRERSQVERLAEERFRNEVLSRALDLAVQSKFKRRDLVWAAAQEIRRTHGE